MGQRRITAAGVWLALGAWVALAVLLNRLDAAGWLQPVKDVLPHGWSTTCPHSVSSGYCDPYWFWYVYAIVGALLIVPVLLGIRARAQGARHTRVPTWIAGILLAIYALGCIMTWMFWEMAFYG